MDTSTAFDGLDCLDCGTHHDVSVTHRCPDCDGLLRAGYDDTPVEFSGHGIGRYAPLLPFERDALVDLAAGGTPLVEVPELAAELGVDTVHVKDEGRSATGSVVDRGLALAVTAAVGHGATDVALPTTGNGGQAAAAHAARAGIDSHSFVPTRVPFVNKAMINVHGGDMNVVEGRYPEAVGAFDDAMAAEDENEDWYSLAAFETPYRQEGARTLAYELAEGLATAPDAVVHPTGHGTVLVGLARGFRILHERGRVEAVPELYAAQPADCAPVVDAHGRDDEDTTAVEHPDTICGPLEVPDPTGGAQALAALRDTGGDGVAVEDEALLDGGTSLAAMGLTTSATGGAAVAAARSLAADGVFDGTETLVLINPTTGNREEDILRSHLMKQGV